MELGHEPRWAPPRQQYSSRHILHNNAKPRSLKPLDLSSIGTNTLPSPPPPAPAAAAARPTKKVSVRNVARIRSQTRLQRKQSQRRTGLQKTPSSSSSMNRELGEDPRTARAVPGVVLRSAAAHSAGSITHSQYHTLLTCIAGSIGFYGGNAALDDSTNAGWSRRQQMLLNGTLEALDHSLATGLAWSADTKSTSPAGRLEDIQRLEDAVLEQSRALLEGKAWEDICKVQEKAQARHLAIATREHAELIECLDEIAASSLSSASSSTSMPTSTSAATMRNNVGSLLSKLSDSELRALLVEQAMKHSAGKAEMHAQMQRLVAHDFDMQTQVQQLSAQVRKLRVGMKVNAKAGQRAKIGRTMKEKEEAAAREAMRAHVHELSTQVRQLNVSMTMNRASLRGANVRRIQEEKKKRVMAEKAQAEKQKSKRAIPDKTVKVEIKPPSLPAPAPQDHDAEQRHRTPQNSAQKERVEITFRALHRGFRNAPEKMIRHILDPDANGLVTERELSRCFETLRLHKSHEALKLHDARAALETIQDELCRRREHEHPGLGYEETLLWRGKAILQVPTDEVIKAIKQRQAATKLAAVQRGHQQRRRRRHTAVPSSTRRPHHHKRGN